MIVIVLILLLCGPSLAGQPGYKTALKQRETRLEQLKNTVKELPAITERMQKLERELMSLQESTGRTAPQQAPPRIQPPTLSPVDPVDLSRFTASQQSTLKMLDDEIRQLEAVMPVLQERKSRIAVLQAQIAILKAR